MRLSNGERFEAKTLVWVAGVRIPWCPSSGFPWTTRGPAGGRLAAGEGDQRGLDRRRLRGGAGPRGRRDLPFHHDVVQLGSIEQPREPLRGQLEHSRPHRR
jgi:hypothetical protein